jgi:peroxiredoxin
LAPDFELPDLAGTKHSLAEFRGRKILLIFFNSQCGHCANMAAGLARLPVEPKPGVPLPVVIIQGDRAANEKMIREHGIRCPVLLQESSEVDSDFQASGTPTGYLIDEKGHIASGLSIGAEDLLALATGKQADCGKCNGQANSGRGKANRRLEHSRINRSGLKAGTPAPPFRLPTLDGKELALEDFRGRRVLLVFSDPECGPCDQLAPQLQAMHEKQNGLHVLTVSRRDTDLNVKKREKLGLTFPIALQKSWEISRIYGMFGTPIGYLIDEQGVIAEKAASGPDAILNLADKVARVG